MLRETAAHRACVHVRKRAYAECMTAALHAYLSNRLFPAAIGSAVLEASPAPGIPVSLMPGTSPGSSTPVPTAGQLTDGTGSAPASDPGRQPR